MANAYSPNRAKPEMSGIPHSLKDHARELVIMRARELVNGGADGANRIHHEDMPQWQKLREALFALDTLEGKRG